ncbi:hypothetical protein F5B22DRAFT_426108 [Xylaria bambusicola]|uniref:uncharacterized protein n=1 Tax=Xylaria bambusicola TaxID=326684 RepID=UPI002007800B|nr:uncharacterized protein F5B22DRAFT_426108 [Xylaria bambusicola]KAI0508317.1 hypothetical protein F5B22DRAFT_426108 [Xylaria bambusicola]
MHLIGPKLGAPFSAPRLTRIVSKVEVERKFNLGPKFVSVFLSEEWAHSQARYRQVYNNQSGGPSFTVVKQPGQIIRDIYYDTQNEQLSALGLWVRQRHVRYFPLSSSQEMNDNCCEAATKPGSATVEDHSHKAQWNAKLRFGGHFNDSEFVEIDGEKNVSDEVLRITGSKTRLEDLQVVTDLQTKRRSWEVSQLADGTTPSAKMTIVMDDVTEAEAEAEAMSKNGGLGRSAFTHTIGEVELFQEFTTVGKDMEEHETERKKIAALRMEELKEFMLANTSLFAMTPRPIGKLTAYDTWKRSLAIANTRR